MWCSGDMRVKENMKNRRWDLVHKFEDEYRRRYLKRLSAEESFKIMEDLYDFAVMVDKKVQELFQFWTHKRFTTHEVNTAQVLHAQ